MRKVLFVIMALVMAASVGCKKESPPITGGKAPSPQETQKEIDVLKEIVKKDPSNANAWLRLGNTAMDSQRYQEAVEAYQKALELDPKNVDARVDMGTCYRNMGQPENAVEEYRKAIALDPNHSNAHRNLGVVLGYDLGRKDEAASEFEAYLRILPNAPDAQTIKEEIARLKGK